MRFNKKTVLALLTCLLLLAVGVGTVYLRDLAKQTDAVPGGLSTSSTTQTDGNCGLPVGNQHRLDKQPSVDQWVSTVGMPIPQTSDHGPAKQSGNLWNCYSHDVAGALVAAHWILAHLYVTPEYAENQMTEGEGRDLALRTVTTDPRESNEARVKGYKIISATPERVSIRLLTMSAGRYVDTPVDLVWDSGDWKLSGDIPESRPQIVTDASGFTMWKF